VENQLELEEKTPQETLEFNYQKIKKELAGEVLSWVNRCSPQFFERLVVDVLVKMGYGGTRREAGQAIGRSGDGGVDGIIKEDRLGLDVIYIQAKRWEDAVGRPEIQKFVGALHGFRARKGVFMTTSRFSREAEMYAANIDFKIILIDGEQLADFMVEYNVGVSPVMVYEIKKIDSDYFSEEL
jgi:restriction system protein